MSEKFTIRAVTRHYYYGEERHSVWHRPCRAEVVWWPLAEDPERGILRLGRNEYAAIKCVGLEGQCVAFAMSTGETEGQKLYSTTPTERGTVEGIERSLRDKRC